MKKSDKNDIISIKTLKGEEELKSLNYKQVDSLCSSIRDEIIDACSKYGGHLSSNLGIVETTVALHRVFSFPKDKLIFDVGHQCYTHKLLSGRSLENLNMPAFLAVSKRLMNQYLIHMKQAIHLLRYLLLKDLQLLGIIKKKSMRLSH